MTYPLVRFVAAPEPTAAVRFDFNAAGTWADDDVWPDHDGFSMGSPSFDGGPGGVGVEYGPRELSFNLVVQGSDAAAAKVLSALARELYRPTNWLMFQKSVDVAPMWFKTYQSEPGNLNLDNAPNDLPGQWLGIGVKLTADTDAYGARVTLPTVTIANDPAAATNPLHAVLPEILGDAPAPLRIEAAPSGSWSAHRILLSVSGIEDPTPAHIFLDLDPADDSSPAHSDVGAPVADAAYSGGSYRPVSFATDASLVTRISTYVPAAGMFRAGRYKALVRIGRSDGSAFALRLGQGYSPTGAEWFGERVLVDSTAHLAGWGTWVELGDFTFPFGAPPTEDAMISAQLVMLQAERVSGTGSLYIDSLIFVPVDVAEQQSQRLIYSDYVDYGAGSGNVHVWDGGSERTFVSVTGSPVPFPPAALAGGFPTATPGATNTLYLISQTRTSDPAAGFTLKDDITETVDVTISYHPRWLWLGAD